MTASQTARVMFGIGGLIVHPFEQNKFLLLKRSPTHSNYNKEKWELLFGRKNEMESIEDALRREAYEELGIDDLTILYPQRFWHFFRGVETPDNEIIGVTYVCKTQRIEPKLSREHTDYAWVTAAEALDRVTVTGIRHDIEIFAKQISTQIHLSQQDSVLKTYNTTTLA